MKKLFEMIEKHVATTILFSFCFLVVGFAISCNHAKNNDNEKQENKQNEKQHEEDNTPAPTLKKLTIGDEVKEGSLIRENMEFSVEISSIINDPKCSVSYETEPANAPVVFTPVLENGKIKLEKNETLLTIKVGDEKKSTTYNVKVNKLSPITDVVDDITILGSRYKGVYSQSTEEQTKSIRQGENVTVEIYGPEIFLALASNTEEWKVLKINETDYSKEIWDLGLYKSYARIPLQLGAKGEITNFEILLDLNSDGSTDKPKTRFTVHVKRMTELADIPMANILIDGKRGIESTQDEQFVNLQTESKKPTYEGQESSKLQLVSYYDVIKTVKINGVDAGKVKYEKKGEDDVWSVTYTLAGITESGTDVHVEIEPKDPTSYSTLHWYFKIKKKS